MSPFLPLTAILLLLGVAHGTLFDLFRWIPFFSSNDHNRKFSDVSFQPTPRYWIPLLQETQDGELKIALSNAQGKLDTWRPIRRHFVNVSLEKNEPVVGQDVSEEPPIDYYYPPDPLIPFLEEKSPTFLKQLRAQESVMSSAKTFFVPEEGKWKDLDESGESLLYHLSPESFGYDDLRPTDRLISTLHPEKHRLRLNLNRKLNLTHVNGVRIRESKEFPEGVHVHLLGGVLSPIVRLNIRQTLRADSRFKQILKVNQLTDIDLEEPNITIFAPTDDSFDELPPGTIEDMTSWRIFAPSVKKVVERFLVRGRSLMAIDLIHHLEELKTSPKINFSDRKGVVMLNHKAQIVEKDIFATNGIIQVIDKIIL